MGSTSYHIWRSLVPVHKETAITIVNFWCLLKSSRESTTSPKARLRARKTSKPLSSSSRFPLCVAHIPLGGSEETHIVFHEGIGSHLGELSANEQRDLLKTLRNVADSDAPPDNFVDEKIGNLDIIRFSKGGRIYSKIVTSIPQGNTEYHVIFVFYIDEDHDYNRGDLATYSQGAQQRMEQAISLSTVDDVALYLEEQDSLTAEDLTDLLDQ